MNILNYFSLFLILLIFSSCIWNQEDQVWDLAPNGTDQELEISEVLESENNFSKLQKLETYLGSKSKVTNLFGELYLCIYEDRYCEKYSSDNELWIWSNDIALLKSDENMLYDNKTMRSMLTNQTLVDEFNSIINSYLDEIILISSSDILVEDGKNITSFSRIGKMSRNLEIYYMLNSTKESIASYKRHYIALSQILNTESTSLTTFRWHLLILKEQLAYLGRLNKFLSVWEKTIYQKIISDSDYTFLNKEFEWESEMAKGFIARDIKEIQELKEKLLSN